jgi:hypothetical protein
LYAPKNHGLILQIIFILHFALLMYLFENPQIGPQNILDLRQENLLREQLRKHRETHSDEVDQHGLHVGRLGV